MDNRRATSLPARFPLLPLQALRYPLATQHGLTGTKQTMFKAIQAEVTDELIRLNPQPEGFPRDYGGHKFSPPVISTSKQGQPGMGMWAQFCAGGHGSCRGEYVRLTDPMLRGEICANAWLLHLLAIRKELAPTPRLKRPAQRAFRARRQPTTSASHVVINRPAIQPTPLDVTVPVLVIGWSADFEPPEELELFPRNENGRLSLVLNDFLALLNRKGFESDLELYRYNAWIIWPLDKPVPISRDDQVVLLRSKGVNYSENWNHYFAML
ncbi:hypothetical protein MVEN_00123900 [Mycena venus]|uniref:Uncharacterized protein n=1 Tax=Mycena venus TaxID=2733690 RepID=A0A8H7DEL9_9AGAR|nr:hypothetical protein MVEN_00123900 [Mycena venus]